MKPSIKKAFLDLVQDRLEGDSIGYLLGFSVSRHGLATLEKANKVIDLPIAEESIVSIAIGMSRCGAEVFVDIMFDAFLFRAMDSLVNQIVISNTLFSHTCGQLTLFALCGPFEGAGPQHGGASLQVLLSNPNIEIGIPLLSEDVSEIYEHVQKKQRPLLILRHIGFKSILPGGNYKEGFFWIIGNKESKSVIILLPLYFHFLANLVEESKWKPDTHKVLLPIILDTTFFEYLPKILGKVEEILVIDAGEYETSFLASKVNQCLRANNYKRGEIRIRYHQLFLKHDDLYYSNQKTIERLMMVL
ncbi:MAG: hypothetical protein AAFN93_04040 [Bacteroidota bacterium]